METQPAERYSCQVPRCRAKRRKRGQPNGRFLASISWQTLTTPEGIVYLVADVVLRCSDCNTQHSIRLVPPAPPQPPQRDENKDAEGATQK